MQIFVEFVEAAASGVIFWFMDALITSDEKSKIVSLFR